MKWNVFLPVTAVAAVVLTACGGGVPAKLAVTAQPTDGIARARLAELAVEVQDTYGKITNDSSTIVSVALGDNPNGATLSGTLSGTVTNGAISFSDLSIDKGGTYTLVVTADNLKDGTSDSFTIEFPPVAALAFDAQPTNGTAGVPLNQVTVKLLDSGGSLTPQSGTVTLSLATNPGAGTLSGTTTANAVNGIATFSNLSLDKAATGYQLGASADKVTSATSASFNIVAGPPVKLGVITQPENSIVGETIAPVVQFAVQDAFGNTVQSSNASVTVALGANAAGATLGGTMTRAANAGVISFDDLTLDRAGNGYTLSATANALTTTTTTPFNYFAATLVYTDPPTDASTKIRVVRNTGASTNHVVVLNVVAAQNLTGYSLGFDLPLDATRVWPGATLMTPGTVLSPGATSPAWAAALPTSGPLASELVTGLSQKAAGSGAVTTDTSIPSGSVLYSVALKIRGKGGPGVVFDGTTTGGLGAKFRAGVRNKAGTNVVTAPDFRFGKLEVQ